MYQILTDSECDLPLATLKDSGVDVIYFHTKVGDRDLVNDLGQSLDINDFYQEGLIGLMTAINTYDETKDTTFYTYATKCIKNNIKPIIG